MRRREPPQKSPQSGAHGLGWPATAAPRARSRIEVLVHRSFYLLLPAVLAPSCIVTALFFHHLELAAMKGWSETWITGSYWVYALGSVATSLLAGPIIDKITAARVMPVHSTSNITVLDVHRKGQESWKVGILFQDLPDPVVGSRAKDLRQYRLQ